MQLQVNRDNPLNGNDIVPQKKKKQSDKISKVETFCYDGFPGKLSESFCFALKPCFQQNLPMFNSNPLKKLKKRKACKSKGTVCFTIEQNILVDLKQVLEGEFFYFVFHFDECKLVFCQCLQSFLLPLWKDGLPRAVKATCLSAGMVIKII